VPKNSYNIIVTYLVSLGLMYIFKSDGNKQILSTKTILVFSYFVKQGIL